MTASANAGDTGKTEAPTAPGRLPLLGHTVAMLRQRFAFTADLRSHGPVVRVHLGRSPLRFVTTAELAHQVLTGETDEFDKGILVGKLRRAFGNGLVSTDGDIYRRQRRMVQPAFHRRPHTRYSEALTALAADLANSWRDGQMPIPANRRFDRAVARVHRVVDDVLGGRAATVPLRACSLPDCGHSINLAPNARAHYSAVSSWVLREVGR